MKKFLLNIWYTILFQFDQHKDQIPHWWYEEKPFEDRPKWMQRVAVAKDVLLQLSVNRYRPLRGRYIDDFDVRDVDLNSDVKSNFEKIKSCRTCAMGACLLSIVKFKNTINFNHSVFTYQSGFLKPDITELLTSLFSKSQLTLIEAAFEKSSYVCFVGERTPGKSTPTDDIYKAIEFGNQYHLSNDTLVAIMQNIIDNNGTFKP